MAAVDSVTRSLRVAHVNTDSLWANYELVGVRLAELEALGSQYERRIASKNSQLEAQLNELMNEFQAKNADLEAKGDQMSETILNMKIRELQELGANAQSFKAAADQEMMDLQNRLGQELANEELKHNKEIFNKIKKYLEAYNADKKFTYILAYANSGAILLGDPTLDITNDVVKGLNDEYFAANPPAEKEKK